MDVGLLNTRMLSSFDILVGQYGPMHQSQEQIVLLAEMPDFEMQIDLVIFPAEQINREGWIIFQERKKRKERGSYSEAELWAALW